MSNVDDGGVSNTSGLRWKLSPWLACPPPPVAEGLSPKFHGAVMLGKHRVLTVSST